MITVKDFFEFVGFFLIGSLFACFCFAFIFGFAFVALYFSSVGLINFSGFDWFLFILSWLWIWASGYQFGKDSGGH